MVSRVSPRNNALLGVHFYVSYDLNIEASREPALIRFSSQGRCPGRMIRVRVELGYRYNTMVRVSQWSLSMFLEMHCYAEKHG